MNPRFLLFLGILFFFVACSLATEDSSNDLSSLEQESLQSVDRVVRDADPGRQRKKSSRSKARKNKRKSKKKTKKIRKNSKRKGKKSRKNKKGKRKNKNKKKQKKDRKEKKGTRKSSRSIDTACVAQLTLSMRRWKDAVTNFQRQSKRITDNQNKGDGKSGKQSVFGPTATKLVSAGGGNKSALVCGGSSTSDGALALTQLAKDLADCEKSVNDSCHTDNFPTANTTLIDECTTLTDKFVEEATKCLVMSKDESKAAEGCACWTDAALTKLTEDVNKCKVKDDMDAIKAQLKACTKAFGACRKLEDAAVESLHACTTHPDEHIKMAATLSAHKDALGNVKSHLSTLSGSRRSRVIRAPATTCAGMVEIVDKRKFQIL